MKWLCVSYANPMYDCGRKHATKTAALRSKPCVALLGGVTRCVISTKTNKKLIAAARPIVRPLPKRRRIA